MITSSSIVQTVTPGLTPDVQVIEQKQKEGAVISVAAYCRVSTDKDIQKQSLETQISAFSKTISEHPGWVLAGIYADRGISGTSVRHREEFLRMIEDAKAGKIQYILVKSISRFSRNTVDALSYVRELKTYGVSVFFDKEKLDTGNAVSEFLLSILAASAQEEIVSLSNNMKVGRRMRYAAGIAQWTKIYGYRKGENGTWEIEEEEAKLVRRLFSEYVAGRSLPEICKTLEAEGVPTMAGKQKWYPTSIATLLHNEKYAGDLRMQKSYISDPIEHTKVDNRDAKIKQYYKENHHPAIVDKQTYQLAVMISTLKDLHRGATQYPYYGFLKCPICGENMIRFSHHRNNQTFAWTCGGKLHAKGYFRKQRTSCPPYYVIDSYINTAFWVAVKAVDGAKLQELVAGDDPRMAALADKMLELRNKASCRKKRVEYKNLFDLVERMTFPKWSVLRVEWKLGFATDAEITYKKIADEPYPTISREMVEHQTKYRGPITSEAYVVNGVPVFEGCPDRQVEGIRRAWNEIQNLIILEPKVYEPRVPRVFGMKTTSPNGGEELAAANKEKRKKKGSVEE